MLYFLTHRRLYSTFSAEQAHRMERLLADHGFRIYEHLDSAGLEERFFERHNLLEHRYPIHPLPGVCCCLAVHR